MAKVDIVVPCYRYGHFLRQCVGSVLTQSMSDVRVLIIDDASPDDSPEVARQIAAADARVELLLRDRNRGHVAAYNDGIAWAEAPYFLVLSADDFLAPGALRRAVTVMDANPDVVLTYGAVIDFFPGDIIPELRDSPDDARWKVRSGVEFIRETCETVRNNVPTPSAIVRTSVQKAIGGYRPELYHAGDMEMWMRFAAHGSVAVTDAVQAFYRLHGNNMSTGVYRLVIDNYTQRKMAFDTLFSNDGREVPGAEELRRLADRRLGDSAFWTGMSQLVRGNFALARQLFAFANRLNPSTRFLPPLAHLGRISRPDRLAIAAVGDVIRRVGGTVTRRVRG